MMFNIPEPRPYANQLEMWRDIIGYEGWYQVSNLGRVKRIKTTTRTKAGRILKAGLHNRGYIVLNLSKNNKVNHEPAHRLVAMAFLGYPPTPNHVVNHINGIKTDNRVENLEWCTYSENQIHAYTTGLKSIQSRAKLTWEQVDEIRLLWGNNIRQSELARRFNVSPFAIYEIVHNKSWVK